MRYEISVILAKLIGTITKAKLKSILALTEVLEISAHPLANASMKSIGQAQIIDHSPTLNFWDIIIDNNPFYFQF